MKNKTSIQLLCFVVCIFSLTTQIYGFDFVWATSGGGEWANSDNWLHLNISTQIQTDNNWPNETPTPGDDVFIISAGAREILQAEGDDQIRTLTVGGDADDNRLRVAGVLTIGADGGLAICANTRALGNGLTSGSNTLPNYVFLETKDQNKFSPGVGGERWTITLTALNNTQFTTQDFNYTIDDYGDGVYLVTYYVSRRVSGAALLYIYCGDQNFLLNGEPFYIPFLEVPPPTVINAFFSSSGTAINVNISISTDRGGLDGHFDCSEILDRTANTPTSSVSDWIGEGGYCYFKTNKLLVVQLGNNALPYVGDTIGIRGGILSGITPFVTVAGDPSSTTIEKPPTEMDSPIVFISAPRYVSPCDEFVILDTTSSLGTCGRDWDKGVVWKLLNSSISGAGAIQTLLDDANGDPVVILPINLFTPGIDYFFSAFAANFFGQNNTGYTMIQVMTKQGLEIDIMGGSVIPVRYDQEMTIFTRVSNPCNLTVVDFSFDWVGLNNRSRYYLDTHAVLQTEKNLWLPSGSLEIGDPYVFMVNYTTVLADGEILWTTDTVQLNIDMYGPIYAIVISGDRQLDKQTAFELDPTTSIDVTGDSTLLKYKWGCTRNTFPYTGLRCFYKQDFVLINNRIQIDGGVLVAGQYVFSLIVYKVEADNTTRSDSATILVEVIDSDSITTLYGVPDVTIDLEGTKFISVHEPFKITGSISGTNVANWSYTFDPPITLGEDTIYIDSEFGLIIPPNTFYSGIEYTVTLQAYNDVGDGYSRIFLIGHLPPTAGRCRVTPTNTTTGINLLPFTVFCTQWETFRGENARTFEFGYISPITGRDVYLTLEPSIWPSADISVPYGTNVIIVNIRGSGGQTLNRLEIPISTPPLTVPSDPSTEIGPIIRTWAAAYASFGAQEQVIHATMSALEWLNCQALIVDPDTNYTSCLWNVPLIYTNPQFEISNRAVRQDAMSNFRQLSLDYVTRYSVRTMAEIYATATTPTSATDQNLIYATQRLPFGWMYNLPSIVLEDNVILAIWEGVWNQLMAQQNFLYSPGEHVPLAQAVTDLISLTHLGIPNGMYPEQPARIHNWKDVHSIITRGYSNQMALDQELQLYNATVNLGSEVIARYQKTEKTQFAWGLVVLDQNTFLYEESSEGIESAVLHVQVIDPIEQTLYTVQDLKEPILFQLPSLPMYNPYNREVFPDSQCVYWDRTIPAWSVAGMEYNYTEVGGDKWCMSSHLTEFALRRELGTFAPPTQNTDPGFGWWIFAGVLATLLVLIIIMLGMLVRRQQQEKKEKELEAFMGPNVVGVTRENIE